MSSENQALEEVTGKVVLQLKHIETIIKLYQGGHTIRCLNDIIAADPEHTVQILASILRQDMVIRGEPLPNWEGLFDPTRDILVVLGSKNEQGEYINPPSLDIDKATEIAQIAGLRLHAKNTMDSGSLSETELDKLPLKAICWYFDAKAIRNSTEAANSNKKAAQDSENSQKATYKAGLVREFAAKRTPKKELEMQNKIVSLRNTLGRLNDTNLQLYRSVDQYQATITAHLATIKAHLATIKKLQDEISGMD